MGLDTADSGTINWGKTIKVNYLPQDNRSYFDDCHLSIVDWLRQYSKDQTESFIRGWLGRMLFSGDDVFKKVSVLSPGEKARVALCKIMLTKANLLLLDEPTNHLDPETQKIIGDNFRDYSGTIIMVSHNAEFIKSVGIDRILLLPSGKIINFDEELLASYGEGE